MEEKKPTKNKFILSVFLAAVFLLTVGIFMNLGQVLAQAICGTSSTPGSPGYIASCLNNRFLYSRGGGVFGAALNATGTALYLPTGKVLVGPFADDPNMSEPRFQVGYLGGSLMALTSLGLDLSFGGITATDGAEIGWGNVPGSLTINGDITIAKNGEAFKLVYPNLSEDFFGTVSETTCTQSGPSGFCGLVDTCNGEPLQVPASSTCPMSLVGNCFDIVSSTVSCASMGSQCTIRVWHRTVSCVLGPNAVFADP